MRDERNDRPLYDRPFSFLTPLVTFRLTPHPFPSPYVGHGVPPFPSADDVRGKVRCGKSDGT